MARLARKIGPLFGTFCFITLLLSCSITTLDTVSTPAEDDDPYLLATPIPPEKPGGAYSVRLEWWPKIEDEIVIHRFRGTVEDHTFQTNASTGMYIDTSPMDSEDQTYEYRLESITGKNQRLNGEKASLPPPSDCLIDNDHQMNGFARCYRIIVKDGTVLHAPRSLSYQAEEIHFLGSGATLVTGHDPKNPTAFVHLFTRRAKGRLKIVTSGERSDFSLNNNQNPWISVQVAQKSDFDLSVDLRPDNEGNFARCQLKNGPNHFVFTPKGRQSVAEHIGVYEDVNDSSLQYVLTHDLLLLTFWKRGDMILKRGEKKLSDVTFSLEGKMVRFADVVARRERTSTMAQIYDLAHEINEKLNHEGIFSDVEFVDGIWAADQTQIAIVKHILSKPKWVVRYLHRTGQNRIGFTTLEDQATFMSNGKIAVKDGEMSWQFTRGLIFPPGLTITPEQWMRRFRADLLSVKAP